MKITYIHHNSFMAELDHAVPPFGYFERSIPETDREKPLFVFTSRRHRDRFSRSIFDLEESHENVTYVLSDGIWARQVPRNLLGRAIFLGLGEEVSLKDGTGNSVDARAFRSAGRGVAFLASPEGRTVYHAENLNSQVWEGEPEVDDHRMGEDFYREMDKLAGRRIDVAFMLVGPRQEEDLYLGVDDFMRMMGTDVVFPMYFWENFQAVVRFKTLACADGYENRIQEIHRRGEEFLM